MEMSEAKWKELNPFFHGTSTNRLSQIKKTGLSPRYTLKSNWIENAKSKSDRVYLATADFLGVDKAITSAQRCCLMDNTKIGVLIILGVEIIEVYSEFIDIDEDYDGIDNRNEPLECAKLISSFAIKSVISPEFLKHIIFIDFDNMKDTFSKISKYIKNKEEFYDYFCKNVCLQ